MLPDPERVADGESDPRYRSVEEMATAVNEMIPALLGHENPVRFMDFQRDLRSDRVQRQILQALDLSGVPPRIDRQQDIPIADLLEARSDSRFLLLGNPDTLAALVMLYADLVVVPQDERFAGDIDFETLRRTVDSAHPTSLNL